MRDRTAVDLDERGGEEECRGRGKESYNQNILYEKNLFSIKEKNVTGDYWPGRSWRPPKEYRRLPSVLVAHET